MAAVVGALAVVGGNVMHELIHAGEATLATGLLLMVGHTALVFAVIGLTVALGDHVGSLGKAGFVVAMIGNAALLGFMGLLMADAAGAVMTSVRELVEVVPALTALRLTGHFGLAIGLTLLGIVGWRSQAYPRGAAGLLIAGSVLVGVDIGQFGGYVFMAGVVVSAVALAWLAMTLWSAAEPEEPAAVEPPSVAAGSW